MRHWSRLAALAAALALPAIAAANKAPSPRPTSRPATQPKVQPVPPAPLAFATSGIAISGLLLGTGLVLARKSANRR